MQLIKNQFGSHVKVIQSCQLVEGQYRKSPMTHIAIHKHYVRQLCGVLDVEKVNASLLFMNADPN